MIHIVYPDSDPTAAAILDDAGLLARLRAIGSVELHTTQPRDEDDLVARAQDADAIVLGNALRAPALARLPRLKLVSYCGIGARSYVDLEAASAAGILVTNTPGYADVTVAEHTIALILALARHVTRHDAALRRGVWDQSPVARQLAGARVGLVGWGGIARRTAALLASFGAEVLASTRSRTSGEADGARFVPLPDLLSRSDIVSIHVALAPETQALIGRRELALMRPGTLLVNTARGAVIDEAALVDALREGRIGGAALDVFAEEPLPPGHPLTELPNVVLTPHVAFRTPEAERELLAIAVDNVVAWHAGTPRNIVNSPARSPRP